jgi:hypothetical protein
MVMGNNLMDHAPMDPTIHMVQKGGCLLLDMVLDNMGVIDQTNMQVDRTLIRILRVTSRVMHQPG